MTTITFPRADVEALVQITNQDEENKLDLFCYSHCDNRDTEFLKQCRGLIYCGETLVSRGFSYSDEYCSIQHEELEQVFPSLENLTFFPSYEGTVLRFFYFNGRWFMSTHRKINAERSKWAGNKNFSKLFEEALIQQNTLNPEFLKGVTENHIAEFQKTLSTEKQYLFIIRTRGDNCIGNREPTPEEPYFFHLATLVNHEFVNEKLPLFPYPEELKFTTLAELENYVTNCDYNKLQGVVCFNGTKHIKVLNKNYMDLVELRGNEPSVPFRYLQLRGVPSMKKQLMERYPQYTAKIQEYESILHKYAVHVHNCYIQRHVKHESCIFPPQVHFLLCKCHGWHLENKAKNIVTLSVVFTEIGKLEPHQLNYIIKAELNKENGKDTKDVKPKSDSP